MKAKITSILSAILLLLATACGSGEAQLAEAERLLVHHPDSALIILSEQDADTPQKTILKALAADLTGTLLPGDSTLAAAAQHFAAGSDKNMQFLALYCTGRTFQLYGHDAKAMLKYTQAEHLIDEIENPAYAALLYTRLAQLYSNAFNYSRALDYYNSAQLHFRAAGTKRLEHNTLVRKAQTLIELKRYGEAENLLLDELAWGHENRDKDITQSSVENLLQLYHRTGYHTKADWLLTSEYFASCDSTATIDRTLAYLQAANNNIKSSNRYMRRAWEQSESINDTLTNLMQMFDICKMRGDYGNALSILENVHYIHDTIMRSALMQPVLSAQRDYYRSQAELGDYRLAATRRMAVVIVVTVLLMLCIVILVLRGRIQAKNNEIERYADIADETSRLLHAKSRAYDDVTTQLRSRDEQMQQMDRQIGTLFKKQFELLDELSGTFYETREIKKDKDAIYRQVRENIDAFMKNKRSVLQLEEIVDSYRGGAMQKLRSQLPQLGEQELRFMVFVYAGFSSKAISIFTQESVGNVYTKKSRIKSIISRSDAPDKDFLIEAMSL